jgi:hypothetical protein
MADPWTEAWEEAVASVPKNVIFHETLELQNPAFITLSGLDSVRVVNDVVGHDFTIEAGAPMWAGEVKDFIAVPFRFGFPSIEEGKGPECQIEVENLGGEVEQYLDDAETLFAPIVCIYRVYLSTDTTVVALGPFRFLMREVDSTGSVLTGKATMATVQNLRFLRKTFGPAEYPGLTVNRS